MEFREGESAAGLIPGLYEQLITARLATAVEAVRERVRTGELRPTEAPAVLSAHIADVMRRALRAAPFSESADRQVNLCNRLIDLIAGSAHAADEIGGDLVSTPELLLAVLPDRLEGLGQPQETVRPQTPLSQDALLVNAPHEPGLASELKSEIVSADCIDLLCAFVVWSGVRVLLNELRQARRRGTPLRVITTTYTGTTDQKALDELVQLGAEVRVSYDTRATRLHAKAWLFERRSGFSTAYVGSSNLTHSAIHEGLEWNVRLTEANSPDLLERFRAAFETYWADPSFEPYDPKRFAEQVQRQASADPITFLPIDIHPYPFQEEILRRLEVERNRHNRWRNLLVAATGTGKTIVSALDYRRLTETLGPLRLLFVAHREEILQQSRLVFRTVLRDGSFGELFVGGYRPTHGEHVFASVQSLSRLDLQDLAPDAYDMLIVDEFHHAEAPTYRRLLEHLKPRVLLGMTATPERTDPREDVTRWFDGHIAYELRLWDALEQRLLCPFQYFGVSDDVSLAAVEWRRGRGYDQGELSRLYTGNDARVAKVLEAVNKYILDPRTMRALGFCVSVEHAKFMARRFTEAGIRSVAITGETPPAERQDGLRQLRTRQVNVVFSVDVFNEGLDIPDVDTVLLLRPTESATVFLQQLGRGLRFAKDKSGLTVLDLIGQQHREFRFEPRLAALTGQRRGELIRNVEQGFPYLPPGCAIQLDQVAQETVLDNLRASIQVRANALADELRRMGNVSLAAYLRASERTLDEVYRASVGGWTSLRRRAGLEVLGGPDQAKLERAVGRLRHIDDDERVAFYTHIMAAEQPPELGSLGERQRRLLTMLAFDLWDREREPDGLAARLRRLWQHPSIREELAQLLPILREQSTSLGRDASLEPEIPLSAHQRYTRNEVLAAFGAATVERPPSSREGVSYLKPHRADLFFITLQKEPGRFSPSTMYHDYAISSTLFHWESQSTTSVSSPTGQRYIHHVAMGNRILLLAREATALGGITAPYLFLGPAAYVEHRGDRPIAITWRLEHPLPPEFYQEARAVA